MKKLILLLSLFLSVNAYAGSSTSYNSAQGDTNSIKVTLQGAINDNILAGNSALSTINTSLGTVNTSVTSVGTTATSIKNNLRVFNGDTGTQILKTGSANNATTTIYTVTAGKTLYITGFNGNMISGNAGSLNLGKLLYITDASDTLVADLSKLYSVGYVGVNLTVTQSQSFPMPIKVPATYKIKTTSVASSDSYNSVSFQGWEE